MDILSAGSDPAAPPGVDPDAWAAAMGRLRIGNALMRQGIAYQPPARNGGRFATPMSPLQVVGQMANAYAGSVMRQRALDEQEKLRQTATPQTTPSQSYGMATSAVPGASSPGFFDAIRNWFAGAGGS
jgi:hypothetical protein